MMFVLIGVFIGVGLGAARVPTIRWIPFLASFGLVVLAVFGFQTLSLITFTDGILLLVSILAASYLYAGALWARLNAGQGVSYFGWVWREIVHPGYLRRSYQEQIIEIDPTASKESSAL